MNTTLIVGVIMFTGFLFGEIAHKVRVPKVTGYILAGLFLNPNLFKLIPKDFTEHTCLVTSTALSFITFSVGGTLLYSRVKKLGKVILSVAFFEAELAFLTVIVGLVGVTCFFKININTSWSEMLVPLCVLLGSLASPTDPSATLAVAHEYKAKGDVSSTIMGVAAFDDVLGIINYSSGIALAKLLILHQGFSLYSTILHPLTAIVGAIFIGIVFGFIFNFFSLFMKKETEGVFIVLIFALLALCFGITKLFELDELLATMTMGGFVVNFNPKHEKIFKVLERYTEESIFVLFFTLGGMHLNFVALSDAYVFILLFVLFRGIGKVIGTVVGASISKSSKNVKQYTALGLIPQGGIVIGLALMIKANPVFESISNAVIGIIIGATVIHEIIGPVLTKIALQKSNEISTDF